jgi:hypothetical protein
VDDPIWKRNKISGKIRASEAHWVNECYRFSFLDWVFCMATNLDSRCKV